MVKSEGFDIFVSGIPAPVQENRVRDLLAPYLLRHGIAQYEITKGKNKGYASIFIHDFAQGQVFLNFMQNQTTLRLHNKFTLKFKRSTNSNSKDDRFVRQKMAQVEASQKRMSNSFSIQDQDSVTDFLHIAVLANVLATASSKQHIFPTTTLSCGAWEYRGLDPVFVPYFTLAGKLDIFHLPDPALMSFGFRQPPKIY